MTSFSGVRQRGIALFVSLIFLLLLTIVGVAGMKSATMQEKMSGNARLKNESFQEAEAGLREGEGFIAAVANEAALAACAQCVGAGCQTPDFSNVAVAPGTCGVWVAAGGGSFYQIQKLGTSSAAVNVDLGETVTLYRVTAVATVGNTTTAVESVYAQN
ncbi:pilus assembly PilX family protein [Halopseudomonas maritima]|uniref:pilus assembly PilX family protein n=1 Tax=Halopseudomonas maritima TaxID=2918528 RepID=UPI001EEBA8F3|nr:PilX N-terminal domain-containing pilus assembly protein [Halopseudomonas maritima]UJJ32465.1 pilus assembly protein PilX [Halopseudomonas maritima]